MNIEIILLTNSFITNYQGIRFLKLNEHVDHIQTFYIPNQMWHVYNIKRDLIADVVFLNSVYVTSV